MAHNQEGIIEENEHSPDFPRYRKRLNIEDEDQEVLSASSDGVQVNLTRSNAFVEQDHRLPCLVCEVGADDPCRHGQKMRQTYFNVGSRHAAKQPMVYEPMEESDDEEDKDLAWFFKKHHPDIDKHRQIAWCRTFANCLAAQMPKLRPKTYKKKAKTEPKEN